MKLNSQIQFKSFNSSKRVGFTLVEVLVSISVMLAFSTSLFFVFGNSRKQNQKETIEQIEEKLLLNLRTSILKDFRKSESYSMLITDVAVVFYGWREKNEIPIPNEIWYINLKDKKIIERRYKDKNKENVKYFDYSKFVNDNETFYLRIKDE